MLAIGAVVSGRSRWSTSHWQSWRNTAWESCSARPLGSGSKPTRARAWQQPGSVGPSTPAASREIRARTVSGRIPIGVSAFDKHGCIHGRLATDTKGQHPRARPQAIGFTQGSFHRPLRGSLPFTVVVEPLVTLHGPGAAVEDPRGHSPIGPGEIDRGCAFCHGRDSRGAG